MHSFIFHHSSFFISNSSNHHHHHHANILHCTIISWEGGLHNNSTFAWLTQHTRSKSSLTAYAWTLSLNKKKQVITWCKRVVSYMLTVMVVVVVNYSLSLSLSFGLWDIPYLHTYISTIAVISTFILIQVYTDYLTPIVCICVQGADETNYVSWFGFRSIGGSILHMYYLCMIGGWRAVIRYIVTVTVTVTVKKKVPK